MAEINRRKPILGSTYKVRSWLRALPASGGRPGQSPAIMTGGPSRQSFAMVEALAGVHPSSPCQIRSARRTKDTIHFAVKQLPRCGQEDSMKRGFRLAVASAIAVWFSFAGCAILGSQGAPTGQDRSNYGHRLRQLKVGMNEQQVTSIMGPPQYREFYKSLEGEPVLIWHYYPPGAAEPNGAKGERTSLFFESGRLTVWGSRFYRTQG